MPGRFVCRIWRPPRCWSRRRHRRRHRRRRFTPNDERGRCRRTKRGCTGGSAIHNDLILDRDRVEPTTVRAAQIISVRVQDGEGVFSTGRLKLSIVHASIIVTAPIILFFHGHLLPIPVVVETASIELAVTTTAQSLVGKVSGAYHRSNQSIGDLPRYLHVPVRGSTTVATVLRAWPSASNAKCNRTAPQHRYSPPRLAGPRHQHGTQTRPGQLRRSRRPVQARRRACKRLRPQ